MDIAEPKMLLEYFNDGASVSSPSIHEDHVVSHDKSPSPVDFGDDFEDVDVEELQLRKTLLLSTLTQLDDDENAISDEEDEEETALRAALFNSLASKDQSKLLSHSLQDNDLDSVSSKPGSPFDPTNNVVRSSKISLSLNEILAITTNAPKVEPVIIPLDNSDSSDSEFEVTANARTPSPVEPLCKKPRIEGGTTNISVLPKAVLLKPLNNSLPKNLNAIRRVIAVKQADVARAEQLVDHLKRKLKNADQLLHFNKAQLKLCKDQEEAVAGLEKFNSTKMDGKTSGKSSSPTAMVPELRINNMIIINRAVSKAQQPSFSSGCWLNFDEFLPLLHFSSLLRLRKGSLSHQEQPNFSGPSISLRWLLLANERAPTLDFLRTVLFTNYFHAIACPFDLSGECKDKHCPYDHISHKDLGTHWILVRLASLCPKALGLSNSEMKDRQLVRARIQNVLAKAKKTSTKTQQSSELELVQFVWALVREALLAEHNVAADKNNEESVATKFNISYRVSELSSNDCALSILSEQDINKVLSSLTASTFKTDDELSNKTVVKSSIAPKLKTLCQILRCRPDFSISMAVTTCLNQFANASDQISATDYILANPSVVLPSTASAAQTSRVLLTAAVFKTNILLTSSKKRSVSLEDIFADESKITSAFLPEDLIYLKLIIIHGLAFGCLPKDVVAATLSGRRCLVTSNWWSSWCSEENFGKIETILTSCVSACLNLSRQDNEQHLSEMQLIFTVLSEALSYRFRKSNGIDSADGSARLRKTCEKFYSKLCADFPKYSGALTLLLAHHFNHFVSPQCAVDFLLSSQCSSSVRHFPSVIYTTMLIGATIKGFNPEFTKNAEILIAKCQNQTYEPADGAGVLGISEHFFISLLRLNLSNNSNAAASLSEYKKFSKSIFSTSIAEKLLVVYSFAVRISASNSPAPAISDDVIAHIISPFFNNQPVISQQKQRYQLLAHYLCCCLHKDSILLPSFTTTTTNYNSSINSKTVYTPYSPIHILEKAFDSTCLSNTYLLDRLIDTLTSKSPDLTYLAGVACRLSCELSSTSSTLDRCMLTLPCDEVLLRLISVLSSPNVSSSSPQTRAVVIHSAFRLAACSLTHHPYDSRLWKLLFKCQKTLSSKDDPLRMYCRLLSQLGLAAPT